jgi:hypothetical protein
VCKQGRRYVQKGRVRTYIGGGDPNPKRESAVQIWKGRVRRRGSLTQNALIPSSQKKV